MELPKRKTKELEVYCINLATRPDRWKRFTNQPVLQQLAEKYPFQRFEGLNGKLIDIKNDERVSLRTKRNIMYQKRRDHEDLDTPGGVGCYLSHYGVWKKFLSGHAEQLLVLEDDAILPDDFVEKLEQAFVDLDQEAIKRPDVWFLSHPFVNPTMMRSLDFGDVKYQGKWSYDVRAPLTGYILSRTGAQTLCDNAFPIDGHVDHFMYRCAQMGMINVACHKDIKLKQYHLSKKDSDIRQKANCEICNIPDTPSRKGFMVLNNQDFAAFAVAAVSLGGLYAMRIYLKK